ncbi:MAG: S8 family serine peptidase [Coleofasciculus sp. C1-SOL-03]|uniref:S8 family serine peptidase n=1 Tax=Coleofasciculus sp. C1-SOL-03 TaxID=3069522 RepID=UPI0032F42E77
MAVQNFFTPDLSSLVAGQDYASGELIVKFKPETEPTEIEALQASLGASVIDSTKTLGSQLWQITGVSIQEAIDLLSSNSQIDYVEPNYTISLNSTIPNDSDFDELWGLNNTGQTGGTPDADIDAPEAWDISTGNNIVVGVIDSGVDYTHPDLNDNMWTNPEETPGDGIDNDGNGYVDDYYGWDFFNNDNNPYDDNGHGTHVAGTIAAEANNSIGVSGVSWSSQIMALKIFDANGGGSNLQALAFNASKAIEYATTMGAHLTNNSWGFGDFNSQTLRNAIAAAGQAGKLFVAAAGNDGKNNDVITDYPSNYNLDNIISVAATDHNDQLANFSNYGATSVDLAAPGVGILSTVPGGGYGTKNGTSMAAPHVSGVASLILAQNPNLTALEVKEQILQSVDPIQDLQGKTVTGGRLNAHKALTNGTTPPVTPPVTPPSPPPVTPPATNFTGDDFDPNIDNSQWSNISSGVAANNFGGSGNSLFFSDGSTRSATTTGANLSQSSFNFLRFDLIFGDGFNGGENADPGEDVVLEYSIDGGTNWTHLRTYDTEFYTDWTTITEVIPLFAQTNNTSFRWRQLENNGVGYDEWALDNVEITQNFFDFGIFAQGDTGSFSRSSLPETLEGEIEVGFDRIDDLIFADAGNNTVAGGLANDLIYGKEGDDILRGDLNQRSSGGAIGGDDIIYGGTGNDRIGGKGGNDKLYGEEGDDQIWGDDGDDLLWGGLGNDQLTGGKGNDTFVLGLGEGVDTIQDFQGVEDVIGLADNLTFEQLSITQTGKNTQIDFNDDTLAILTGVNASTLTADVFTVV